MQVIKQNTEDFEAFEQFRKKREKKARNLRKCQSTELQLERRERQATLMQLGLRWLSFFPCLFLSLLGKALAWLSVRLQSNKFCIFNEIARLIVPGSATFDIHCWFIS